MTRFSRTKLLNYSKDLVFSVVADVQKYPLFVPACQGVFIKTNGPNSQFSRDPVRTVDMAKDTCISAEMAIGFQGFSERYLSQVTLDKDKNFIKATAIESPVFSHLETIWHFEDVFRKSTEDRTPSSFNSQHLCSANTLHENPFSTSFSNRHPITRVHFTLDFEFSSRLYQQFASFFLSDMAHRMMDAFDQRCSHVEAQYKNTKIN